MKNKLWAIALCICATVVIAGSLTSFDKADDYPAGTSYYYAYTLDTIANAANDTLYLPANMRPVKSDFSAIFSVTRTNISGTTNLAVTVEETAYPYSGTTPPTVGWTSALNHAGSSATTAATTATTENLRIPHTYGQSYRVIIDGTGTQSSSYRIAVLIKKLN